MPDEEQGLKDVGRGAKPASLLPERAGLAVSTCQESGLRTGDAAAFDLPATQQERLTRSIWHANRIALDAPHWFGLSGSGDDPIDDDPAWDDLAMPQRFGIFTANRASYPGPINSAEGVSRSRVLTFPLNAGFGRQSVVKPPGRSAFSRRATAVLPFCVPASKRGIGIFSLAGGVGTTSLAAGIARMLASCGERVLLADAGGHSLLAHYFGGRGSRQGAVRRFLPQPASTSQPIRVASLEVHAIAGDPEEQERILMDFSAEAQRVDRVVWDLGHAPADWVLRVLQQGIRVMVPLLPAAKCLMQLAATEQLLQHCQRQGYTSSWQYLVNQFDPQDPAHAGMRTRFRAELGNRLLPFVVRTSPLVNEALLRGRTIVDHAPASPLIRDLWRCTRSLAGLPQSPPPFAPEMWDES